MPDKIGEMLDKVQSLRIEKSELENKIKAIDGEISQYKTIILEQMQINGIDSFKSDTASCYIKEKIVGNVVDLNALLDYISQTGEIGLLQTRVNNSAYAECIEHNTEVPGVNMFKKTDLLVRKI
jgi:hypothetical protein